MRKANENNNNNNNNSNSHFIPAIRPLLGPRPKFLPKPIITPIITPVIQEQYVESNFESNIIIDSQYTIPELQSEIPLEDKILQSVLEASMEEFERELKRVEAEKLPQIAEERLMREEQDREYEEALRADREKELLCKPNVLEYNSDSTNSTNAYSSESEELSESEETLETPVEALEEDSDDSTESEVSPEVFELPINVEVESYVLRFRLPYKTVTHTFLNTANVNTIISQLKRDTGYNGDISLTLPDGSTIESHDKSIICNSGILNRMTINVNLN